VVNESTTLGRSEKQILEDFRDVIIPRIIEYEFAARQALIKNRPMVLDDLIWRAWGTLTHSRLLGTEETLAHLSMLRLGVALERTDWIDLPAINELFLLTQPGHLQKLAGGRLDGPDRRQYRAQYVRQRLGV
jgi:protein arginine kinase